MRLLCVFSLLLSTVASSSPPAPTGASDESAGWSPLSSSRKAKPVVVAPAPEPADKAYVRAIGKTAGMVGDARARTLVSKHGLQLLNVTWEDTGRYKGSAVGPNISDMTIQVGVKRPGAKGYELSLMPVIRYDNFTDRTADVDPRFFTLLVGNEKDGTLKRISLSDFLGDPTRYLSKPGSWKAPAKSLLAPRDTHVLVSAQACFLPVPKKGKATFNPVLFNYQSRSGDPAVLTLLVTRQGTSVTVIDNKRDGLPDSPGWGQRLFHNQNGQRAPLTGERMSDFRAGSNGAVTLPSDDRKSSGFNMVLLVQIPLKQKRPMRLEEGAMDDSIGYQGAPTTGGAMKSSSRRSDVEAAVIGHGDFEGLFTEIDELSIERDPTMPIRVTVQFYKATATGEASETDIRQIKEEIDGVLAQGDAVGSLVVGGETGRPTEYEGVKVQPADWWQRFWERHRENTGEAPEEAIARYRRLVGNRYAMLPTSELLLCDRLRCHRKR